MPEVVAFKRRRRTAPRRRSWLRGAPWPPLAALVGVTGALWVVAEGHPNIIGAGAAVSRGSGAFVLCAGAPVADCVIDGDTIRHRGIKIRLADIDAPEVFSPRCAAEARLGRQATARLLELLNAGPFALIATSRDEDRYGRKLRVIARGGRSLGATLIAEGLARPWDGARRSWCG